MAKQKQDPNRARKRNFTKFRLSGMKYSLKNICNDKSDPLLREERIALRFILKDIEMVLKYWDENYTKLKKENNINEA